MIYKEITLSQALQMVVDGEIDGLFFGHSEGLYQVRGRSVYLENLHKRKWFRRIPAEKELAEE